MRGRSARALSGDVVFWLLFGAYALGGILVLFQGVGAAVASAVPSFHAELHVRGLETGMAARTAQRMADASHDVTSGAQVALDYGFSIVNLALAGFLLWLRPRERTSRLLAVGLVGTAGIFNLTAQHTFEVLPLFPWEVTAHAGAHVLAGLAYVAALVLFPDGRPVPRWRPSALGALYLPVTVGAVGLTLRVGEGARPASLLLFFGLLIPVAGVAAQAYRFERSATAAAHQQARLLFWALLPALVVGVFFAVTRGALGTLAPSFAGRHLPEQPVLLFRIFQPVFAIIPAALFAGLLRYRLWDIDRILNRTLVYGLVTGLLGGAYFGVVVVFQRVFSLVDSDLAVAVSTLAVAAAFHPLRRRIQGFVDRRFYRSRYDAARTIEGFSARLRDEVDLEALTRALEGVVVETMRPCHVSLWLRDGAPGLTTPTNGDRPVTERVTVR